MGAGPGREVLGWPLSLTCVLSPYRALLGRGIGGKGEGLKPRQQEVGRRGGGPLAPLKGWGCCQAGPQVGEGETVSPCPAMGDSDSGCSAVVPPRPPPFPLPLS